MLEPDGGQGSLDHHGQAGDVEMRVRDHAYLGSSLCLPHLIFDDLPMLAEG